MRTYLREAEITYRRAAKLPEAVQRNVRSSADVAPIVRELIGARITESFLVFALDAKNRIIGYHEVARGAVTSCPVTLGDVFRYPLLVGAVSMIVAHNHPSGDTTPSAEDVAITGRIKSASKLLGLSLLDHIVVGEDGYASFLDDGLLVGPG